jgi:hypothetical protein
MTRRVSKDTRIRAKMAFEKLRTSHNGDPKAEIPQDCRNHTTS